MTAADTTPKAPNPPKADRPESPPTIAVLGNPNVGKTTLFNRLAGLRLKSANFPGTTQDAHLGTIAAINARAIDLPGLYALHINQPEAEICRAVLNGTLAPVGEHPREPDRILIVADATNLRRNLLLVGQALALRNPTALAINMKDAAERRGIHIDTQQLDDILGCSVTLTNARNADGIKELTDTLADPRTPTRTPPTNPDELERWADDIYAKVASARSAPKPDSLTDRLDTAFTHPILGVALFAAVMTGLFYAVFALATYPMDWIDALFAHAGALAANNLPEGAVRDLLTDGVIAGVGATLIFLPQIVLLFFLISILEGTGYLARAAFVIDRLLRPFGLSGHAFVPFLSGHACALPGIMAARTIPDPRDRLATILSLPFMSCTARIPVYVLLTTLLFPGKPLQQTAAFIGCYALGIAAGLLSALIARRTILRGPARPMALELPAYRPPDLRAVITTTIDRAWVFIKKAGVFILAISIVLWWLGEYPKAPDASAAKQETTISAQADTESYLARLGNLAQPVFEPLGYDRQLTIGVLASFAAREVFVSTMAVQIVGTDDLEEARLFDRLANAERADGTPMFTVATSWSLLVYYVLAMQCLPTLVVTAREAGAWKWAGLQLGWMLLLAYSGAAVVYQSLTAAGVS